VIHSIDHIGIAVSDLEKAKELYRLLFGVESFHEEVVESQGVSVASFELNGIRIELTAPTNETSPISGFIEKRGEGIHHIAYRTDSLEQDLERLDSAGLKLINHAPQPGAHNMMIAFVHPKSTGGVLMELCAEKK